MTGGALRRAIEVGGNRWVTTRGFLRRDGAIDQVVGSSEREVSCAAASHAAAGSDRPHQ